MRITKLKYKPAIVATLALMFTESFLMAASTGGTGGTGGSGTGDLAWSQALGNSSTVSTWIRSLILVVMSIFVMAAVIMGSLAFKQLAADGNWKDFWSKIAGAVGMFVTPIAVYYAARL